MEDSRCPFTGGGCDGGEIHPDGSVGCGFKESIEAACTLLDEVPEGESPGAWRMRMLMQLGNGGNS